MLMWIKRCSIIVSILFVIVLLASIFMHRLHLKNKSLIKNVFLSP